MQLIENASAEKLRGAYYTPAEIAHFILRWGMDGLHDADVLEPSCGDGVFIRCMAKNNMKFHSMTAIELEAGEAEKAKQIDLHNTSVINTDFHRYCLDTTQKFDLIVGNPPFIRYQYYAPNQQLLADEIFKKAGLKRTKLTNAWVTFVVGCALMLKEKGKMGFVIPSELLQVKYAKQLRKFLSQQFNKINIISFENLVFADIQQDVVLLLCEKNSNDQHLIDHKEVKNAEKLNDLKLQQLNSPTKKIDFHTDKWTYYFLDQEELDILEHARTRLETMGDYADVEVGITTGSNEYFTVPQSVVDLYQLKDYARPMVGRSVQVNSLNFTTKDWQNNVYSGAKALLLVFQPDAQSTGNDGVKAYLANGESLGIHEGYKTGIRDYWYVIPSIKVSDALFLRRNNIYPKFVLNEAEAYTTDTMHRVFIHEGVNKRALVASYYNSLSFAFAEILGRNFGGGCLELMPSEVSDIYIPYREENEQLFDVIDKMLRDKKSANEILDVTDKIILHHGMGFTDKEVSLCRSIWNKVKNRRLNRESVEKEDVENIQTPKRIKQLNIFDALKQYPTTIVENRPSNKFHFDMSKNVLISLVKEDNIEKYIDHSAKIYYSGKKFPSSVALNKLYYFIPYIKTKGIRDLYIINIARIGYRKEGQSDEDKNDLRLVFEIEYLGQLFDDYKPIALEIWRTFTDTTMDKINNL